VTAAGWATVVAAFITAIGAVVVARFNTRQAKAALVRTAELQSKQIDADAYQRARDNYDAALAEQERRIERLRRELDDTRTEHHREVSECMERIGRLERDRESDRSRIRRLSADLLKLVKWGRRLIALLQAAQIEYPDPPINLADPDPPSFPPGKLRGPR
jgi:septal ring factor EnvC (AmiA/AmiB activator)